MSHLLSCTRPVRLEMHKGSMCAKLNTIYTKHHQAVLCVSCPLLNPKPLRYAYASSGPLATTC